MDDIKMPSHTWELYELLKTMAQKTGYCCPTDLDLMRWTKHSKQSVRKSINRLCENGLITKKMIYTENGAIRGRKITIV